MSKLFPMTIGEVRFHPPSFSQDKVLTALRQLEGVEYTLACRSTSNSHQLNSDFDVVLKNRLVESGFSELSFAPKCGPSIDFDFALDIQGDKVVFEIEKANKEKILWDILKMHVYLEQADIATAVLIVPVNWAHSGGTEPMFSLAQERFDLCQEFGMRDTAKMQRMLLVGFTQCCQGRLVDRTVLHAMKRECQTYFLARQLAKEPV